MSIEEENKLLSIEEEYELWKTNVPLMYDFVSETKLTWPSLTIQWLPGNSSSTKQEMILGTHTSGEDDNYLKIASIELPEDILGAEFSETPESTEETEQQRNVQSRIKITKKIKHEEEITRARFMPQDPNFIATINGVGKVFLFDRSKDKNEALVSEHAFHKDNGYGLSFNPRTKGELLSCSDDGTIALWNVMGTNTSPSKAVTTHEDIVNDCTWHEFNENLFGSVSEDKTLQIHDKRTNSTVHRLTLSSPFNTLDFSKHSQNLFAAAGTDSLVYLYDLRNTADALHTMSGHEDSVTSLEFSPHKDGILCSSGSDRRVLLWDLMQIGSEQAQEDAADGVPELIMMHAGHKSAVNDFSFNWNIPWLMASVEEDNIVHVWKVSKKLTSPGLIQDYDIRSLE